MALTEEEVRKIAKLAKLRLTSEEVSRYQAQLLHILNHMAELSRLDTAEVPPTASVLGLVNVTREDEPKSSGDPERLLSLAPEREGPYYKVRKVIE